VRDDFLKFQQLGAQVVVIARHDEERVRTYWQEHHLPFPGIPDPDAKLGDLYHQQWSLFKLGLMPALFVVDRDGKIAYAYYSKSMSDIPSNEAVFGVLRELQKKSSE